jgi:hypothetical protein
MTSKKAGKKPGLNLTDLAPMYEDVPIGESFLRVSGISAKTGLEIFRRFPNISGMTSGTTFNLGTFLAAAPDAVAAIIAAATGDLGDESAEQSASELPIEIQFDILEAVGRLTFTKGFAPFAERIMALADAANSALSSKVTAMTSPPASKPSSLPDTPQA